MVENIYPVYKYTSIDQSMKTVRGAVIDGNKDYPKQQPLGPSIYSVSITAIEKSLYIITWNNSYKLINSINTLLKD